MSAELEDEESLRVPRCAADLNEIENKRVRVVIEDGIQIQMLSLQLRS